MTTTEIRNDGETIKKLAEAQEFRAVTDTVLDATSKAIENMKTVLMSQQDILQSNFKMWQRYNQTYFNLVIEATQRSLEQAFALREQLDKLTEDNLKKAQELRTAEEVLFFEVAGTFQAQIKAASERITHMVTPIP